MTKHSIRSTLRVVWPAVVAACLAASTGCSHLDVDPEIPWFGDKDDDPVVPIRVVTVWKDAVLRRADVEPIRGFGGRLVFYDEQSEDPVRVEGELVVYVFDEEGREPTNTKPDRKYVFTAEQFAKHYSESKVGHSYSVWVPWDAVGGVQKHLSLIALFKPVGGPKVVSEQVTGTLPGVAPPTELGQQQPAPNSDQAGGGVDGSGSVEQVSYEATVADTEPQPADEAERMDTHTITLPAHFGRNAPSAEVRQSSIRRDTATRRTTAVVKASEPATSSSELQGSHPTRPPTDYSPPEHQAPSGPPARPALDRSLSLQRRAG